MKTRSCSSFQRTGRTLRRTVPFARSMTVAGTPTQPKMECAKVQRGHQLSACTRRCQRCASRTTLAERAGQRPGRRPGLGSRLAASICRSVECAGTAFRRRRSASLSRAITDFSYCCYLSDLAVDVRYQHRGIGKRLIRETHIAAGVNTALILIAAPAAEANYPRIGMKYIASCWMTPRQ